MSDLNFSIIIPHYNIPKLLQRCLDSIPQRPDLEVIVVDDNSSPDIVDFNHFPGSDRSDVKLILDKKGEAVAMPATLGWMWLRESGYSLQMLTTTSLTASMRCSTNIRILTLTSFISMSPEAIQSITLR